MASSGSHHEGARERKKQVHPELHNTHSSNLRIPEGGVWKAVMGQGWWGRPKSPAPSSAKTRSVTRRADDTDLKPVKK